MRHNNVHVPSPPHLSLSSLYKAFLTSTVWQMLQDITPPASLKLWCHWHVSTSTSPHSSPLPDSRLWMWQKDATHPVPNIPFLNSVQHCLLCYLSLCDGHYPPHPPSKHSLELSPFSCGQQQSTWGLSYQRETPLHITQLTRQQPKPEPEEEEAATQCMDPLPVVSHTATTLLFPHDGGF